MITVKKSEYNKAKLRKLFREASQQYIQITEEEAAELGLIEQTPTGEIEPIIESDISKIPLTFEALSNGKLILDLTNFKGNSWELPYFEINNVYILYDYNENYSNEFKIFKYDININDKINIYVHGYESLHNLINLKFNFTYKLYGNCISCLYGYFKDIKKFNKFDLYNIGTLFFNLKLNNFENNCKDINIYTPENIVLYINDIQYNEGYQKSHIYNTDGGHIYFKNENLFIYVYYLSKHYYGLNYDTNIICINEDNLTSYNFYYVTGASPLLLTIKPNTTVLKNKNYNWDLSPIVFYPWISVNGQYEKDYNNPITYDLINDNNIRIVEYDPETFEILGNIDTTEDTEPQESIIEPEDYFIYIGLNCPDEDTDPLNDNSWINIGQDISIYTKANPAFNGGANTITLDPEYNNVICYIAIPAGMGIYDAFGSQSGWDLYQGNITIKGHQYNIYVAELEGEFTGLIY